MADDQTNVLDQAPPTAAGPTPPPGVAPAAPWPGVFPQVFQPQVNPALLQERQRVAAMSQSAQATAAAMRYQAQMGFNRDIQGGMAPADAMAKWAPSLFFSSPNPNIAQAGAFIRSTRPAAPRATPTNPFDLTEFKGIQSQIGALQKQLDEDPFGPAADEARRKMQWLQGQAQQVRTRTATPAAAPTPAPFTPPTPAQGTNTVIRRTKSGRRAIFDAATKKFIRYADAQ
jgi:hypothetical protein